MHVKILSGLDGRNGNGAFSVTGGEDLRRRALHGGAYLMARYIASAALKLIGMFVIARQLGPAGYGAYVAAFAIVQFPFAAAQAGLAAALLREDGQGAAASTLSGLLALPGILLLWAVAPALGAHSGIDGLTSLVALLAVALPFQFAALPAIASLERRFAYREIALIELGGQLVFYGVAIGLTAQGFGPTALAFGFIAQQAGQCLAAWRLSRLRPQLLVDGRAILPMLGEVWTLSAAHAVFSLRLLVTPLLIAPLLGAQAVGVIGLTVAIVETLAGLKTVAWRISLSLSAQLRNQQDRLQRAVLEGRDWQLLLLGGLLLAAGLAVETAVPLLFGSRWGEVAGLYPFVALAMLVNAGATPRLASLAMTGRDRAILRANAGHLALFASACAVLTPSLGLVGYGIAELIALSVYAWVAFGPDARSGDDTADFGLAWTAAIGLALFWRELGPWTLALPVLALALPGARSRLRRLGRWRSA